MNEWTPQPGELTVDTATNMTHREGVWRYVKAASPASFPNMCRRLLPACNSTAEAWEALKGLPGAKWNVTEGGTGGMKFTINKTSRTAIHVSRALIDGKLNLSAWADLHYGRDNDDEQDLVRQAYFAIREWLAGVASREAEHGPEH